MKSVHSFLLAVALAACATPVAAQHRFLAAGPSVCVAIDEARDTMSADDRRAALTLVARQFDLAGRSVVKDGCGERYSIAHVRLGTSITVILTGPDGDREAVASEMNE